LVLDAGTAMVSDMNPVNALTEKIIGCAYKVSNTLGCGYLEKVYKNALAHELRKSGMKAGQQTPLPVYYDGELVGDYLADLLVEDTVIVELKAVKVLDDIHAAQCMNYLKSSRLPVCLLLNFARPRLEIKRFINRPQQNPVTDMKE
jgi:GxxExxY protein